jgi:catechol 2,3-dioxygenase-like lactoylglutathione lyase family enzyme
MQNAVGAMTLFVADTDRAREFYARAFELEPIFEDDNSAVFKLENTLVNLLDETAAPPVIEPLAVGSGTRALYTIWVDDCDAAAAQLRARGVDLLNDPVDRPWGQRTAAFADPDGHAWELAQTLR